MENQYSKPKIAVSLLLIAALAVLGYFFLPEISGFEAFFEDAFDWFKGEDLAVQIGVGAAVSLGGIGVLSGIGYGINKFAKIEDSELKKQGQGQVHSHEQAHAYENHLGQNQALSGQEQWSQASLNDMFTAPNPEQISCSNPPQHSPSNNSEYDQQESETLSEVMQAENLVKSNNAKLDAQFNPDPNQTTAIQKS